MPKERKKTPREIQSKQVDIIILKKIGELEEGIIQQDLVDVFKNEGITMGRKAINTHCQNLARPDPGYIVHLMPLTWARFVIWMLLGLLVYFLYSRQHSILAES